MTKYFNRFFPHLAVLFRTSHIITNSRIKHFSFFFRKILCKSLNFHVFIFIFFITQDGNADGNGVHGKLRLTIPREPDLETAHRAQRIRYV